MRRKILVPKRTPVAPLLRPWIASMEYWATMMNLPQHDWSTPHRVVAECANAKLLYFGGKKTGRVMLINPPQASHSSSGCDFGPGRSLVQTAVASGIGEVYAIDWKSAGFDRRNEDIGDFVTTMYSFIDGLDRDVDLNGVCQGGWQAAIYAALYPERVRTLTLVASPIDFHGGESKISEWVNALPDIWFQNLVAMGNGVLDGRYILLAFKMMHPTERFVEDNWKLYLSILEGRWEEVQQQVHFRSWYDRAVQNLPGSFYLQVVRELFKKNSLVRGELEILGQRVDLKKITCPTFLVTGDTDDITPDPQACAMKDCVSTSCSCRHFEVEGGHFATFAGSGAMGRWKEEIFPAIKTAG